MALPSFVESTPRAYRLKAGNADLRYFNMPRDIPEAGVLYKEGTSTLLCGDLFTHLGDGPALTEAGVVGPAIAAEDLFHASNLNPSG